MPLNIDKFTMILKDPVIIKDLKAGLVSVDELAKHLLANFPATVLAHELAQEILDDEKATVKPIVLSMEQFEAMFRVTGYRLVNGELQRETRGHYKKKE